MTTPYMNLDLPVPTVTPGPEWATETVTALETVDSHDHTLGKGVQIPSAGINIDADLDMNSQRAVAVKSVQMDSQVAALPAGTNIQSVYVINGNLFYNNATGTPVQITDGISIVSPSSPVVPPGIMSAFGGVAAPTGYLLCDGTAVSRVTYSDLFAAVGTVYGVGDGSTTFNLPDAKGRTLIGAGTYIDPVLGSTNRALGVPSGAAAHVLSTAELANHTHIVNDFGHVHGIQPSNVGSGGVGSVSGGGTLVGTQTASAFTGISLQTTGSNSAHNNMQPYLVINYIIKT